MNENVVHEKLGKKLTSFAVINIFHGVNVPTPCSNSVKNINLYLSYGGFISILARSIVIPKDNMKPHKKIYQTLSLSIDQL